MTVIVNGDGNIAAGRDVNVNSDIDNSKTNISESLEIIEKELRDEKNDVKKYEKAKKYLEDVSKKVTAEALLTIAKTLLKAVLGI